MGAARFGSFAAGKTPEAAFSDAVGAARYQHGAGGYSGSISEKRTFQLFTPPLGIAALDFVTWVRQAETSDREDLPDVVRRAAKVSNNKWGPAAAVEIKGEELAALSKKYQFPQGERVFYFFGWASE